MIGWLFIINLSILTKRFTFERTIYFSRQGFLVTLFKSCRQKSDDTQINMPDFTKRSYKKELMDDLTLHSDALKQNLIELRTINFWLGGNLVLIKALNKLKKQGFFKKGKTYTIADIGSGGGDNLIALAKWFEKNSIKAQLTGIDANDFMIEFAKEHCKDYANIDFMKLNVFDTSMENQTFDLTTCSLFCHHFTNDELTRIFHQINKITNNYFIINDLHRYPLAYYSIWLLVHLFNGSYLVKNDAPLSVLRAFKKQELKKLIEPIWKENQVTWVWAFRWMCLIKTKV